MTNPQGYMANWVKENRQAHKDHECDICGDLWTRNLRDTRRRNTTNFMRANGTCNRCTLRIDKQGRRGGRWCIDRLGVVEAWATGLKTHVTKRGRTKRHLRAVS